MKSYGTKPFFMRVFKTELRFLFNSIIHFGRMKSWRKHRKMFLQNSKQKLFICSKLELSLISFELEKPVSRTKESNEMQLLKRVKCLQFIWIFKSSTWWSTRKRNDLSKHEKSRQPDLCDFNLISDLYESFTNHNDFKNFKHNHVEMFNENLLTKLMKLPKWQHFEKFVFSFEFSFMEIFTLSQET